VRDSTYPERSEKKEEGTLRSGQVAPMILSSEEGEKKVLSSVAPFSEGVRGGEEHRSEGGRKSNFGDTKNPKECTVLPPNTVTPEEGGGVKQNL